MKRDIQLDALEARVLGVLVEKTLTTPDQYPLTLNSTTTGSNQKSNRLPVLSLDEDAVSRALARLENKGLVRRVYPGNSRVEKYTQLAKEAFGLPITGVAVLAELLLRGPQTMGELRAHAARMVELPSLDDLMSVLQPLLDDEYIERLAPAPGSRAERFLQRLSPGLHPIEIGAPSSYASESVAAAPGLAARVEALEEEVARLRTLVERLMS